MERVMPQGVLSIRLQFEENKIANNKGSIGPVFISLLGHPILSPHQVKLEQLYGSFSCIKGPVNCQICKFTR